MAQTAECVINGKGKGTQQTHKVSNSWENPEYYFENGLRKVKPYEFIYRTYAKERWIGKTILKVFSTEFRDRSKSYYEYHLLSGKVLLNGQVPAGLDTVLKNGDYIENRMHRHEPPVAAKSVEVVHHDEANGILIVNKMGSLPVHSTGRYHHNTMLHVLRHEHNFPLVRTANRLDRLTSGVMVCATTVEAGRKLAKYFNPNQNNSKQDPEAVAVSAVKKEYVARVLGCFPTEDIDCREPLLSIDKQIGINVVHPQGRPSQTIFKRLSYDPSTDTSVVHCFPITGRTHQIRVHLQYLGYPIANDPIYNNVTAWGPDKARGGVFRDAMERKTRAKDVEEPPIIELQSLDRDQEKTAEILEKVVLEEADVVKEEDALMSTEPSTPSAEVDDRDEITYNFVFPTQRKSAKERREEKIRLKLERLKAKEQRFNDIQATAVPKPGFDPLGSGSAVPGSGLNEESIRAITELRRTRDEEENFGRWKDAVLFKSDEVKNKLWKQKKEQVAEEQARSDGEREECEIQDVRPPTPSRDTSVQLSVETSKDEFCVECGVPILPDPKEHQLCIWLHAIRYYCQDWDYSSGLPDWAMGDWKVPETWIKEQEKEKALLANANA